MKAILIDPARRVVEEVEYDKVGTLGKFVGGYITLAWQTEAGDVIYVDDEGMLKPQGAYFRWTERPDEQPLAGKGILVGPETDHGDTYTIADPTMSVDEVTSKIIWLTREQVDAWGKANASEPMISITTENDDGSRDQVVLRRTGEFIANMPKGE